MGFPTKKPHTRRLMLVEHKAAGCASATRSSHVEPEHLWVGLLEAGEGVGLRALTALGVDPAALRERIRAGLPSPALEPVTAESFVRGLEERDRRGFSDAARQVLTVAAEQPGSHLDTGHLLIGLMGHGGVVAEPGLTLQRVHTELTRQRVAFAYGRPGDFDLASADELIAVPRVTVPAEVRTLDEAITQLVDQLVEAADAEDFEALERLRTQQKQLQGRRAELVQEWAAGVDVLALADEVETLRAEVERLRSQSPRSRR